MDGDPNLWQMLILQLVLIAVNAVFACAEIAVISMNDTKLERMAAQGDKRAKRLQALTSQPAKFLATIQVGITLAGFLGSAFAADNFSAPLVTWLQSLGVALPEGTLSTLSVVVITIILSYVTLIFGELVPKRVAMTQAEKLGLAMSGFVSVVAKAFAPLVWLLTKSTNGVLRLVGIDPNAEDEEITEEEIRMMVDVGSEKGAIDIEEKTIIQNVFEFDNKTAEEVMTHRTEIVLLWQHETDAEWETAIHESRHSCYPVCGATLDDIVGILYAKDYFRLKDKSRENVLAHAVYAPQFVPETVRTDVLFRNMKTSRNHVAIVLDEYGGMSGVVTMNDLLEQLVGELDDEFTQPAEAPDIVPIAQGKWSICGTATLDEVALATGAVLPDEHDTFAGLVFGALGTIPADGETPLVTVSGLAVQVEEIIDHRLERATVSKLAQEPVQAE